MKLEEQYTEDKKLVVGKNDLLTWCNSHKEIGDRLKDEWLEEYNGSMSNYKAGSSKEVYWKCLDCGEIFTKDVRNRVCGRIHGPCGKELGKKHLQQWHVHNTKNTLARVYPELLKEWDIEKNKESGIDPYFISAYSSKKVWWICPKCKTSYAQYIRLRTVKDYGCKNCKKKKRQEDLVQ